MFEDNYWSKKRCHNVEFRGKLQPRGLAYALQYSNPAIGAGILLEPPPGRFLIVSRPGNLLDCYGWLEPV